MVASAAHHAHYAGRCADRHCGVLLWFVLFRRDNTLRIIEQAESDRTKLLVSMQDSVVKTLDNQTDKFTADMRSNVEVNGRTAKSLDRWRRNAEAGRTGRSNAT